MDMGNRGILLDTAGRRNKELGTRNKKYIDRLNPAKEVRELRIG